MGATGVSTFSQFSSVSTFFYFVIYSLKFVVLCTHSYDAWRQYFKIFAFRDS